MIELYQMLAFRVGAVQRIDNSRLRHTREVQIQHAQEVPLNRDRWYEFLAAGTWFWSS